MSEYNPMTHELQPPPELVQMKAHSKPRFLPMEEPPKGETFDPRYPTKWWQDTWRPLSDADELDAHYHYMAVETDADKDPNNYRKIEGEMRLLFTDQQEWSVVCENCFYTNRDKQWSGTTRGLPGWRRRAEQDKADHMRLKGWCEFCDPIFGNGGWV